MFPLIDQSITTFLHFFILEECHFSLDRIKLQQSLVSFDHIGQLGASLYRSVGTTFSTKICLLLFSCVRRFYVFIMLACSVAIAEVCRDVKNDTNCDETRWRCWLIQSTIYLSRGYHFAASSIQEWISNGALKQLIFDEWKNIENI